MFCYGRHPPLVDYIGEANPVVPPAEWDGSVRTAHSTGGMAGNYTLYYCIGPAATPCAIPGAPPPTDPTWMTDPFLPPPTNLRLENSPDGCQDLPTLPERIACAIAGMWTGGVPSLLWDWDGAPNYTDADLTGFHVVLRSQERHTGTAATVGEWDVLRRLDGTLPRVIIDRMDRSICGMTYEYNVSAVASNRRSSESTAVMYNTPDCFQPVDVTVTFNTLLISPTIFDCGDWLVNDNALESTGTVSVVSTVPLFINLDERSTLEGGSYTFAGLWGSSPAIIVPVNTSTQTVTISTRLTDKDSLFECNNIPDWCRVDIELPGRSSADWAALNMDMSGSSNNTEGGCTVGVHVQGAIHP
jgi:hypothetical protein